VPAEADTFAPALAIELIDLFGINGAFQLHETPDFDIVQGQSIDKGSTIETITMSPPIRFRKEFKSGDVTLSEYSVVYMKGNESFAPKRGMRFTLSGVDWGIIQVDPLISGELVAAYRMVVNT